MPKNNMNVKRAKDAIDIVDCQPHGSPFNLCCLYEIKEYLDSKIEPLERQTEQDAKDEAAERKLEYEEFQMRCCECNGVGMVSEDGGTYTCMHCIGTGFINAGGSRIQ